MLEDKNIDLNVRDIYGHNVIGYLAMREKDLYIEHLKDNIKNEKHFVDCKLDETLIDNEVRQYKLFNTILKNVKKSDYKSLESIINSDESKDDIDKIINFVYVSVSESDYYNEYHHEHSTIPLIACVSAYISIYA